MDLIPYVLGKKGPAQTLSMQPGLPVKIHVVKRPTPGSGSCATLEEDGASAADFVVDCPEWFCIHMSHATQSSDGRTLKLYGSGWPPQPRQANGDPPAFLGAWGGEAPSYEVKSPIFARVAAQVM